MTKAPTHDAFLFIVTSVIGKPSRIVRRVFLGQWNWARPAVSSATRGIRTFRDAIQRRPPRLAVRVTTGYARGQPEIVHTHDPLSGHFLFVYAAETTARTVDGPLPSARSQAALRT